MLIFFEISSRDIPFDVLHFLRFCEIVHAFSSCNAVPAAGGLANFCYIYRYDKSQRMVVKKLPGADSVLMVYDRRDRLVATQDGVQRVKSPKEWLFTKYDELNRPILTGTIQSVNTRVQMQTAVNAYSGTNLYETRTTSSTHHYLLKILSRILHLPRPI